MVVHILLLIGKKDSAEMYWKLTLNFPGVYTTGEKDYIMVRQRCYFYHFILQMPHGTENHVNMCLN